MKDRVVGVELGTYHGFEAAWSSLQNQARPLLLGQIRMSWEVFEAACNLQSADVGLPRERSMTSLRRLLGNRSDLLRGAIYDIVDALEEAIARARNLGLLDPHSTKVLRARPEVASDITSVVAAGGQDAIAAAP